MMKNGIKIFKEEFFSGEHEGKLLGVEIADTKEQIVYLERDRNGNVADVKASIYFQTSDEPVHIHPLTLIQNSEGEIVMNDGVTEKHVKKEIQRASDAIDALRNYIDELYGVLNK